MGLLDHTIGSLAAVLALGQGAVALRTLYFDRKMMGQIALSIEPKNSQMAQQIDQAHMALVNILCEGQVQSCKVSRFVSQFISLKTCRLIP